MRASLIYKQKLAQATMPANVIISKLAKRFTGFCKLYLVAQSNIKSSSLTVSTKAL